MKRVRAAAELHREKQTAVPSVSIARACAVGTAAAPFALDERAAHQRGVHQAAHTLAEGPAAEMEPFGGHLPCVQLTRFRRHEKVAHWANRPHDAVSDPRARPHPMILDKGSARTRA